MLAAETLSPDGEPRTVLLIEDNPGDARLIQEMLRGAVGARFRLECADRLAPGLERRVWQGLFTPERAREAAALGTHVLLPKASASAPVAR